MVNKDQVKKIEKGVTMTRFWYTLKNLDPLELISCRNAVPSSRFRIVIFCCLAILTQQKTRIITNIRQKSSTFSMIWHS